MSASRYCSVLGCHNNKLTHPELSFFSIPTEDKRCLQWLRLIAREDLVGKPAYHYICEEHMNKHDIYENKTRKVLKKTAIPRYQLPTPIKGHKGTQVKLLIADSWTQVYVNQSDASTQTNSSLTLNSPYVKKLKSQLLSCRKRLKFLEKQPVTDTSQLAMFHKLCDRFLSEDFSKLVKAQSVMKNNDINSDTSEGFAVFVHKVKTKPS